MVRVASSVAAQKILTLPWQRSSVSCSSNADCSIVIAHAITKPSSNTQFLTNKQPTSLEAACQLFGCSRLIDVCWLCGPSLGIIRLHSRTWWIVNLNCRSIDLQQILNLLWQHAPPCCSIDASLLSALHSSPMLSLSSHSYSNNQDLLGCKMWMNAVKKES
jgi:hypothetical protein